MMRKLLFFQRSASILSSSSPSTSRQVLKPLSSAKCIHNSPPSSSPLHHRGPYPASTDENLGFGFGLGFRCRGFHSSVALSAQHAVAEDFSYEERAQGSGDDDAGLEIARLGISGVIVQHLAKKGIAKLFPIQKAVLEPAMQGRDMIGRAKTGTGKTLAFGIPIMDKIIHFNAKHGRGRNPLALVLAPTRELARQVEKEFRESSDLNTICVYGGTPISQQMRTLDYGVDVVVGTPGRVIDLLKRGALNMSEVQFVVLDEADQMLAVGFAEDVEIILEKLPVKRQSMMFSATMPNWIIQLTRKYLNDPVTIDLVGDSDQKLAEGITLYSIPSDNYAKASIIGPLITEHGKGGKCIVFTQTKRDADKLAYFLGKTIRCEALHGDITQDRREKTLSGFRDGHFNVLVATDVAARGLDVPNVDLVIHYELPNSSEIFVHRSGRTGRAGKKGSAILIYSEQQAREVRTIEQHVGCRFKQLPRITVEGGAGLDMFNDMGDGRFGSYGRSRAGGSGFGRSGGYGGSGFGRSGGFGGPSTGHMGGYGDAGSSRSGFFQSSGSHQSDEFGGSRFGHSAGFGASGSGRSSGFGEGCSGGFSSSGGFGDSGSGRSGSFGTYGAGHSGSYGGSTPNHSSGSGSSSSSTFGGSGGSSNFGFGNVSLSGRSF